MGRKRSEAQHCVSEPDLLKHCVTLQTLNTFSGVGGISYLESSLSAQ